MHLISYAQNQEDVMLWRAVKHVRQGFYIDVGAAHPSDLSVTKLFYDHGWSGINIEPNADYFKRLTEDRPRDVNLAVVAASAPGERIFHNVNGTGLSTLDYDTAIEHQRQGFEVTTAPVQCRTLADICIEYRPDAPIHFLKIDVEGSEREVLDGSDFSRFRPWIVLVEATRPMSQQPDHASWEPGLLYHGYQFVWFDGLNRFYVASEQVERLKQHFSVQPNVFDGFVRAADLIDQTRLSDVYAQDEKHARERAEVHIGALTTLLKGSEEYAENERSLRVRSETRLDVIEAQAQKASIVALASIEEAGRRQGEAEHRAAAMAHRIANLETHLDEALQTERSTARSLDLALLDIEEASRRAESAAEKVRLVESALTYSEIRLLQSEDGRKAADDMVKALLESTSWRVTRPFRIFVYILHGRISLRDFFNALLRRATPALRPPRRRNHKVPIFPSRRADASKTLLPAGALVDHEAKRGFMEVQPGVGSVPSHPSVSIEELLPRDVPGNQTLARNFKDVQLDLTPKADQIHLVLRQKLRLKTVRQQPRENVSMNSEIDVRLIIDIQGAQGANAKRGIGRYSRELAVAMARVPRDHDIVLALNGSMTETAEELTACFSRLLPARQVQPWFTSASNVDPDGGSQANRIIRARFLSSLKPDMVHVASVFEGIGDNGVTFSPASLERLPMVATIYDLIPFIRRKDYLELGGVLHEHQQWYFQGLHELSLMDGLLAISESSRQEAITHLGFSQDCVFNIRAGIHPDFHPSALDVAGRDALLQRHGLNGPFILFVGAGDIRKNEAVLVDAYSRLPLELQREHQLVVIGHVDQDALRQVVQAAAIPNDRVVLIPSVCEGDLVLLYGECSLFVFPSLHEGFGLPPAEAMACGAPVIASNVSSLPEVVGCPDALFDPTQPTEIAALMVKVLRDSKFRDDLVEHGKRQAAAFTWQQCAERTWDALESLHDRRITAGKAASYVLARLPSLAFISPLPPDATGIADYSRALIPPLARHYNITLVSERNKAGDPWLAAVFPSLSAAEFRAKDCEFDRILYQLGCSDFHLFQYQDLMPSYPGVSVLHDAFLSNLWNWVAHHNGRPEDFLLDLYRSHGYASVAFDMKHGRDDAVKQFPCSLPVLESSFATIVHSKFAAALLSRFFGSMADEVTHVVPLLANNRPRIDRAAARSALGLSEDELLICSFGLVSPAKLPQELLRAWRSVRGNRGRLVFVGAKVNGLGEFINEQEDAGVVWVTGRVDRAIYDSWLSAADIAVQLRTDSRGETSAAIVDCLYFGVPLIISDHGSATEVPDDCVVKLSDPVDCEELRNAIERIRDRADVRQALSAAAVRFVGDHLQGSRIANMYHESIETAYRRPLIPTSLIVAEDIVQSSEACAESEESMGCVSTAIARTFQAHNQASRLLIDMSELARRDSRSGIQRVVREVGHRLLQGLYGEHRTEAVRFDRGQLRQAHDLASQLLDCRRFCLEEAPMDYGQNDILLCLDLNPNMTEFEFDDLRRRKLAGMRLVLVVYDLLPMLNASWFPQGISAVSGWYTRMLSLADQAVCISKSVADELIDWLQRSPAIRTTRPLPIHFFHLAGDFSGSEDNNQPDAALLAAIAAASRRPTFVMVGTLEPRKGYLQTLAAFEQIWADRKDVGLVIVGKLGWHMEGFGQRLRQHVQLGTKLHWLERTSDSDLRRLYSVGACLLMASEGEGFGLPIVEAAEAGLPILARDLPVFREIAGDYALYFSGSAPEVLVTAILSWCDLRRRDEVPRSQDIKVQSWDSSVRQLSDCLQSRDPYHLWIPDIET